MRGASTTLTPAPVDGFAAGMDERIDHRAVVGAVAGGLDHDVAGKAEMVAQRVELLPRRIAGRVFALRRVTVFGARAEHMAVRVHGAGRQLVPGF